jgi:hypothetical protein
MDKQKVTHPDTEALRVTLQSMERRQVKDLCEFAGLALPTVTKFRAGLIREMGYAKALTLKAAIAKRKPASKRG